jgi:hypothetical protein
LAPFQVFINTSVIQDKTLTIYINFGKFKLKIRSEKKFGMHISVKCVVKSYVIWTSCQRALLENSKYCFHDSKFKIPGVLMSHAGWGRLNKKVTNRNRVFKGHVTRCNFSCNLQCNSTLERC